MLAPGSKIKTVKIWTARAAAQSVVRGYFAEASKQSDLSNLNGSLSASASLTAMEEANEAVKRVTSLRERASREEVTL